MHQIQGQVRKVTGHHGGNEEDSNDDRGTERDEGRGQNRKHKHDENDLRLGRRRGGGQVRQNLNQGGKTASLRH